MVFTVTSLKNILIGVSLFSSSIAYASDTMLGLWRSIDDKTGFSKSIVEIKKESDGTYSGTIVEVSPRPGYTPQAKCVKCPAPYTNQRIVGMKIIKDMQVNPKKPLELQGGTVIDPLIGKVYKSHIKINPAGNRLTVRGFIGVSAIGRSQTWLRHYPAPPVEETNTDAVKGDTVKDNSAKEDKTK